MNKTLAISAIVLVAVIMGMSSVAIGLPQAMAGHDKGEDKSQDPLVAICHKGKTIWVWPAVVAVHIAHGDTAGPC